MLQKKEASFRKNDYKKKELGYQSLSKKLSLFKPAEQNILMPGSHSLGPYVKSNDSLYYLAPHKFNEYFASEILLRLGILSPKCGMVFVEDEDKSTIPYDILIISWDEKEDIDITKLHKITSHKGYRPTLIKQGEKILLYGAPNASQWKLTELQNEVFSELKFRKPGDITYIMDSKSVASAIYKEIALKKAHMPSIIASKSLDGFIPMQLIRRNGRSGEKLTPRHFDYLNAQQRAVYNRYQLDITNQMIYDHVEHKAYRISGNLFGTDIAALLICDLDFQSDGANLGVIKVGNRFYAAAIDKDAVRFKGESYEVLAQKLSDRSTNDFLYKSRMDDQLIAVVYQNSASFSNT